MSDWVRRGFTSIGGTQSPPGRHLAALQDKYMGKVLLCIDVSGSMSDRDGSGRSRLEQAVLGARQFVGEAVAAHYQVGLILWDDDVHRFVPLTSDPEPVYRTLRHARIAGGTALTPTLRKGIQVLGDLGGDRVIAVFSDGEIFDRKPAAQAAREAAARDIRILVRGLGSQAAASLDEIATEGDRAENVVESSADIASGIASMAKRVTRGRIGRAGG